MWPLPQLRQHNATSAAWLPLASTVSVVSKSAVTPLLGRGMIRYQTLLRRQVRGGADTSAGTVVERVAVQVKEEQPLVADRLALDTDYSHTLNVASDATVTIVATGSYGALYALETLVQLATNGSLLSPMRIEDYPSYPHRGLMLGETQPPIMYDSSRTAPI